MRKEKICIKCYEEFFNRGSVCNKCYNKDYYSKNKDKISIKKHSYYLANKDLIDKKSKEYTTLNKEKVNAKNRKHYYQNKEEILLYQKTIRHTPKRKYGQAVKSAKERELCWEIMFEQYEAIISQPCHYCYCSLYNFGGSSLDRIDNLVGYVLTNVLPCCGICNNIRNNFLSVKEMEVAMAAVVEFRKGETQ